LAVAGTADPSTSAPTAEQLAELPADLRAELNERAAGADEQWVRGFTYAPEQHGALWLRDRCDSSTVDNPALPDPAGLAISAKPSGGTLPAVTHQYQIVAVNGNGHTGALAPVTISNALNDANVLTWDNSGDVTYSVYGRVSGSMGLLVSGLTFPEGVQPTWTDTGSATPGAAVPSTNTSAGPGVYTNLSSPIVVPFLIEAEDTCSSFGWEARDPKGRAMRWLDNGTPQAVEREFFTGNLATANGYPNDFLANAATVTDLTPGSVPSVTRGLQILQDALAQNGFGGQGMIHVQPQTAPSLLGSRRNGALLLDIFDNVIIPGVGYTGFGPGNVDPGAGYAYIYATDLVMVRSQKTGTIFPDSYSEALDRGENGEPNTVTFRAERFAAAYADWSIHACVKVQLST
jgi:hypothetical protein